MPETRRRVSHDAGLTFGALVLGAAPLLLFAADPVGAPLPAGPAQEPPTLARVLERVGAYVTEYERSLGTIIGEERYEQTVDAVAGLYADGPARTSQDVTTRRTTRRLVSEFVMLRLAAAPELWTGVRDVLEVDGKPVHDRDGRLERLLSGPEADVARRWRELAEESSRFNPGPIVRDFNVPTFALVYLRASVQPRSAFEHGGAERVAGVQAWKLRFTEQRTPAIVRDTGRQLDVLMRGEAWVDPATGRVLRTVLESGDRLSDVASRIEVRYARDARLGAWLPVEMREHYQSPRATVTGKAAYGKFRRFETEVRLVGE